MQKILLTTFSALLLSGCNNANEQDANTRCSDNTFALIEEKVGSSDGAGHGPDIGSGEWQSTIEFRLGIRGDKKIPAHQDPSWCTYILKQIEK